MGKRRGLEVAGLITKVLQVMYVFLGLDGLRIVAEEAAVVDAMMGAAAGEVDERDLAQWLEAHVEAK